MGVTYFSICGAGETTLQNEIADITYSILKNGHYVNITTNGTIGKRLEIVEKQGDYVSHLHFAFSLHYLELKRLGLLNTFSTMLIWFAQQEHHLWCRSICAMSIFRTFKRLKIYVLNVWGKTSGCGDS